MSNKPGNIVVIGSVNMDLVAKTDRFPQPGETIIGHQFYQIPGGKGANQAVAAARLGAEVSFIGCVGDDLFGQQLSKGLDNEGINLSGLRTVEGVSSGLAHITLTDTDNTIIVIPGANAHCTPEHIAAHESLIAGADIVLMQLEIPLHTVQYAVQLAERHGIPVILNPAPAHPLPNELLQGVTYLTPNETELAFLAGGLTASTHSLQIQLQVLLNQGVKHVVATQGERGVLFGSQDSSYIHHQPAHPVQAIDTTGAGDAFNAGLAVALAEGNALSESVTFASAVGALAVTKLGAQPGMPTRDEVMNFIKQKG